MKVSISYFIDNGALTLEQQIQALVSQNNWPIDLTIANDEIFATCQNEQELRVALRRRGI